MTSTMLVTNNGVVKEHTGTLGFTVTGTRTGDDMDIKIEYDSLNKEEGVTMIAMILAWLEEGFGEGFVTACFAKYALDTGKPFYEAGDHQVAMIRGEKRQRTTGKYPYPKG